MTATKWPVPLQVAERFWAKVDWSRGPTTDWPWTGTVHKEGYGVAWYGERILAHRLAYLIAIGPIPDDMTIDHVKERGCRSRLCCNPAHLEAVTRGENTARGLRGEPARYNPALRRTHAEARLAERFWLKVARTVPGECWPWLGYVDPQGKARVWRHKASSPAQRIAWELGTGEKPDPRLVVENTCTTQNCMNPAHLRSVSRGDSRGNTTEERHQQRIEAGRKGMDVRWHQGHA